MTVSKAFFIGTCALVIPTLLIMFVGAAGLPQWIVLAGALLAGGLLGLL